MRMISGTASREVQIEAALTGRILFYQFNDAAGTLTGKGGWLAPDAGVAANPFQTTGTALKGTNPTFVGDDQSRANKRADIFGNIISATTDEWFIEVLGRWRCNSDGDANL